MKSIAIDSAISKMCIACRNDDHTVSVLFDIGMKQSEKILPAIDYVLKENNITPADLDYTALCSGPGSFTGLRLAFSALKAIEMAHGIPIYGISTLAAYAFPYANTPFTVLPVIDAKKDKFYVAAYKTGTEILSPGDYEISEIVRKLQNCKDLLVCGPDREHFCTLITTEQHFSSCRLLHMISEPPATEALFSMAEQMISLKEPALKDFDGPIYLRVSEAEEMQTKK